MDELLRPFDFEFFRNGLMVATMAGALCGLVGVYVVLKGMSYIGHGLSHAIFGGFAASTLLGINFLLGAGAWGVASALMINGVTRRRVIGADAAIGVITTASFALGLALFAFFDGEGGSFDAALFGSILGVGTQDVLAIAVVCVLAFDAHLPSLPRAAVHDVRSRGRRGLGRQHRADGRAADAGARRLDPRHDEDPRRHADRGHARHPRGRRPDAHQLVQPHALVSTRIGAAAGSSA